MGGDYAERIRRFDATVNQEALLACISGLRQNQPCTLSPEFSVGHNNLVRKITFGDGVEWIARLSNASDGGRALHSGDD